jgi:magnesium transporter
MTLSLSYTVDKMIKIYRTEKQGGLREYSRPSVKSIIACEGPDEAEFKDLIEKYKFDWDMVKDFLDPYESPRVERYNNVVYLYLRSAIDTKAGLATEPVLLVKRKDKVIICFTHSAGIIKAKQMIDSNKHAMAFLQIVELVNKTYFSKLDQVSRKLLAAKGDLRRSEIDNQDIVKFIDIEEDLVEYEAALSAQKSALTTLLSGKIMKLYEDDADLVEDLTLSLGQLLELVRSRRMMISGIRETYTTITANNLNKMFKRLTSISILLMIPSVIGGIYGMNVILPFGGHRQGFWIVSGTITVIMFTTALVFRKNKWF